MIVDADGQKRRFDPKAVAVVRPLIEFDEEDLQRKADLLAGAVGIDIYGGDCVVKANGTYCIIDFNDWPSFSRCREEAADAIVALVEN